MKTHAGFNELVDRALEEALADLMGPGDHGVSSKSVIAPKVGGEAPGAEVARKKIGEATSMKVVRKGSRQIRRPSRHFAADDSQKVALAAEFSGIIDHNSALLAVAGAAVSADCDRCLDAIVPELEGIGMSKDDVRAAVESGRFPRAFPHLTAETFERACEAADEDILDCIER